MKKLLLLTALTLLLCSCGFDSTTSTGESISRARHAIEDEGYKFIRSDGAVWLGCSEDDSVWTSEYIVALNSNQKEVTLRVCCGGPLSFKGCTVRH